MKLSPDARQCYHLDINENEKSIILHWILSDKYYFVATSYLLYNIKFSDKYLEIC